MGSYAQAAEHYDLLYSQFKDYQAEASRLIDIVGSSSFPIRTVLDVGCGTGRHAEAMVQAGFAVDGIDLEPEFVRRAQARNPAGHFRVADMRAFEVDAPYDLVLCLFGSIGYALDPSGLKATMNCLAGATRAGGTIVVEPWMEPGELRTGHVTRQSAQAEELVVCRVSRATVEGAVSRIEFEYLIARPEGIERRSEVHELGLFSREAMVGAMEAAGLRVVRDADGLMGRGAYVATKC